MSSRQSTADREQLYDFSVGAAFSRDGDVLLSLVSLDLPTSRLAIK